MFKVDPEDQGNLPERLLPLSRALARVLRHTVCGQDSEGWTRIDRIMDLPEMSSWTEDDLDLVVAESFSKDKPRFEVHRRHYARLIRATHHRTKDSRSGGLGSTCGGGGGRLGSQRECGGFGGSSSSFRDPAAARRYGSPPRSRGLVDREIATPPPVRRQTPQGRLSAESRGSGDPWAGGLRPFCNKPKLEPPAIPSTCVNEDTHLPLGLSLLGSLDGVQWTRYQLPECDGTWWHCSRADGEEDFFIEESPGPWSQFFDPGCERAYWYNADSGEFFFSDK